MKKLLTLIMPDIEVAEVENAPEEIEILSYGGEIRLADAVKRAKGKYTVISAGDAEVDADGGILKKLEGANADILKFGGEIAVKTGLLKSLPAKNYSEKCRAEILSVLGAKSVENLTEITPFTFEKTVKFNFTEEKEIFLAVVEEFKKSKSRLSKEIYSLAVEVICSRLAVFYARSLIAVRAKKLTAADFAGFDYALRENVVLYLALAKRLTVDLNKIRSQTYKITYFEYLKLKKLA